MRGPDADLSYEESEDILEDPKDESVLKKRISDSDEEESTSPKTEFMGTCFFHFLSLLFIYLFLLSSLLFSFFLFFYICIYVAPYYDLPFICMSVFLFAETLEGLGVAADIGVPSAVPPATPLAPVSAIPSAPVSVLPTAPHYH